MENGHRVKAHVNLEAIASNFRYARSLTSGRRIMAVVKANAYGHGAVQVARRLEKEGVDMFGVATLGEAISLRDRGVTTPVLILTPPTPEEYRDIISRGFSLMVYDLDNVNEINMIAKCMGQVARVHLKVDTGMGRFGCTPEEAPSIARHIHQMEWVDLEGVATHFPRSDEGPVGFTLHQVKVFRQVISEMVELGVGFRLVHAANSGAILSRVSQSPCNMVRPGLMLYGYAPSRVLFDPNLRPAMEVVTRVIQVKRIKKGTPVGYGHTFHAPEDGYLAVLPIGYADGYPRALSNRGYVWIAGHVLKISGRVCMDSSMVFAPEDVPIKPGDEAVVMGVRDGFRYLADDMAEATGSIPYEVTCSFTSRVPRFFTERPHSPKQPLSETE